MTDLRSVANPFTKNEGRLKRNTRDSRWVTADSKRHSPQQRSGPGKTVQFVTQESRHVSHVPAQLNLGSGRSSNDEAISPKTRTHSPPISPMTSGRVLRRDSPVSAIDPIDFSHLEEARKGSNVTVFPYFPSTIKKPETKAKQPWWKQGVYRAAKEIYKVGPEGEGQKVWKGYKHFREKRQRYPQVQQNSSRPVDKSKPSTIPQPAAPRLAVYPPATTLAVAPSLRPPPTHVQSKFVTHGNNKPTTLYPRKDTGEKGFSYSYRGMPVGIDRNIQQTVNVNKPLPPIPQLQPAPKTRRAMDLESAYLVGTAAASMQHPTQRQESSQRAGNDQHVSRGAHASPWWRALADKQTAKTHDALKAKISRPGLLTALSEGRTVNVATDCGGVGGPGAAHTERKEVKRPPPLHIERPSERKKGKQKARDDTPPTHWRDKFDPFAMCAGKSTATKARRRKSSDASFACQGLSHSPPYAYTQDPGPSTQFRPGKNMDLDTDHDGMVPQPLFSGGRGGNDGIRDTRFYQPYNDVLSEY